MRYSVLHVDDAPAHDMDPHETDPYLDVTVFVPDGSKVCAVVPLGALHRFMPILHEAHEGCEPACCPACGEELTSPAGARA